MNRNSARSLTSVLCFAIGVLSLGCGTHGVLVADVAEGCVGAECTRTGLLTIDSPTYHVDTTGSHGVSMRIRATYRNTGTAKLYFARLCGTGASPAFSTARLAGDTRSPVGDETIACSLVGYLTWPAPIAIAPGASHSWSQLLSSGSPPLGGFTRYLGTFVFVAHVQSTNRGSFSAVDLIPLDQRSSAPFTVLVKSP